MVKTTKSFLVFVAILCLFGFTNQSKVTHMGVSPSEHVVLECVGGAENGCGLAGLDFVRILPDGTTSSGYFRVPKRKVLVITDVDWQYKHDTMAYRMETLQIWIVNVENFGKPGPIGWGYRVFESTIILNEFGEGGISESMTTGFLVTSKARICPRIAPGPEGPPSGLQHLILRGYLIPARKTLRKN